ncbi:MULTISPECIES: LysR family transcriptional regulator substrate-binding protein [Arthrobacter]|uniref:LysR family transcriptional regulator substrate-binding protein n=2 Tax=Arthrobacter TaxID=1663 RepID=A0ABU9KKE3_9MICC|nr:LysR family transcriptional regulator substrate-binding protein [Arthrobacter sp. YJM1]MDP5226944.1 LysR family transcriptional regulator substrate-binding protein [Arthrobacter sp. YJM1]
MNPPLMDSLTFLYVPGVTPGKWIRRWEERLPDVALEFRMVDDDVAAALDALDTGEAQLAFLRVPVGMAAALREGRFVIPLYEEQQAVVAAKGHEIQAFEEISLEDLEGETFFDNSPEGLRALGGLEMALEVVASGAGLLVLPMPAARHVNNPEVVARPLEGAEPTEVVLAWRKDADSDLVQEFVGIVRGRKADSGRQPSVNKEQQENAAKARKSRSATAGAFGAAKAGSKGAGPKGGAQGGAQKGRSGGKPGTGKPGTAKPGGGKGSGRGRGKPPSSGRKGR